MSNLGINFSLAKPKRKDHLIVCFIAIVIITIIDIYCISIRKSSEPFKTIYHKNSPNSLSILTRVVTAFLPSYLPFKNSSVQCRRCTYPFFFLCTFGSFFILPVVNFFLFIEWLRYREDDQIRWKSKRLILTKMGCFWVKEIHTEQNVFTINISTWYRRFYVL